MMMNPSWSVSASPGSLATAAGGGEGGGGPWSGGRNLRTNLLVASVPLSQSSLSCRGHSPASSSLSRPVLGSASYRLSLQLECRGECQVCVATHPPVRPVQQLLGAVAAGQQLQGVGH